MTKRATSFGFIILIAIYIFGTFCCYDLVKQFNLTSKVLGYFQHSTSVSKINDFEYDITNLLFTNSGANENEYFAEVITTPVEGFDKNKNYTLKINDINATRVYGDYSYINVELMNKFYSTQDTLILTDILNIKVNFYTDGTKIVFITKNGESAVKLWSSYIQKNGFNIKIVEDKFNSTIEADNIPNYTINLYAEDVLVQTLNFTSLTFNDITLPTTINNKPLLNWRDSEGNIKTKENLTLQSINLYAEFPIDYTINLFVDEELYQTLTINELTLNNYSLPNVINNIVITNWQDIDGNIYNAIPLKNINLFAICLENGLNFTINEFSTFERDLDWVSQNETLIDYYDVYINRSFVSDDEKTFVQRMCSEKLATSSRKCEVEIENIDLCYFYPNIVLDSQHETTFSNHCPKYYVCLEDGNYKSFMFYISLGILDENSYQLRISFAFEYFNSDWFITDKEIAINLNQYNSIHDEILNSFEEQEFTFDFNVKLYFSE